MSTNSITMHVSSTGTTTTTATATAITNVKSTEETIGDCNKHSNNGSNYSNGNHSTIITTTTTSISTCSSTTVGNAITDNRSNGVTNLCQFLCILCTCLVCYYNSIQCGLVFDDISAIRDNKDLRPATPWRNIFMNDFWGTPMRKEQSHKSYRPLTVLTFRLNYWWHELQPYGYHLVNVLLHMLVCLLWRRVCRLLLTECCYSRQNNNNNNNNSNNAESPKRAQDVVALSASALNRCSFVATLLFAVHPIHTEAVTGVVGRAELLSSICFLGAFLAYADAVTIRRQRHNTTITSTNNNNTTRRRQQQVQQQQRTTNWFSLLWNFVSCLLASMLCKEQGITIAGICVAYELFVVQQLRPLHMLHYVQQLFEERKLHSPIAHNNTANNNNNTNGNSNSNNNNIRGFNWRRHGVLAKRLCFLVCVTLALLVGRVYVMGSQLPVFTRFDNPASAADTPTRQLTYSYLIYLNCWLLLFPCDLCCDWTMGTIPLIESFADPRNVATLCTFVALAVLAWRACCTRSLSQSRILLMCLAWLVLPFLPASNLFFPVGFVVAERILYMPSMGFCLLVAYGFMQLEQHLRVKRLAWLAKSFLALLLLTHAVKTHQRNHDWRTEYSLFTSGLHVNARNAKLFNNVGHALENEGRYHEALEYFKQAVNIQADDIGAHINVGRTYNALQMYREAEEAYRHAKALFPKIKPGESYQARIAPNHLNVFINLANLIAKNQTRLEEADQLYRQAISMRADYVQAYINRGDILMKLNRTAQAQEVYEKALLYDSENADIYYNLGVVCLELGKSAQAHVYFNKAIELYPEHEQALLNSAILLQELGDADARQLSRERLYKVLARDEHNEKVHFNLGMLAMDEGDFDGAEVYFKRAIHLKESFRSALFNLALLLADANRPLDAVPFLHQLIRHHPDHVKGLILLGDIYINHMKDLDAAETCYRSILKYEPHNIQGLHNLCVVFVERKRLAKAAACLRYAHHLAPSEDYILRHLQIVQTRLQKIAKLPDTAQEKRDAFAEYDAMEFQF